MQTKSLFLTLILATLLTGSAIGREQIKIVGSSTVFPYTQAVSESFSNNTGNPSPVVESTGTGGGFKAFCEGVGESYPDITGASRAMKSSEYELCVANGVGSITEVLIGYDGLSIAHSNQGPELALTKHQIFQALAAEVEVDGKISANPYKNWSEIDASLPATPIVVFGPPPTSGTRDAFVELVMHPGCEEEFTTVELTDDQKKEVCSRMRQDGPFIEAGENDNLIVQRLKADTNSVGIFGYSFLYENSDSLKGIAVDGVVPNTETIADGSYQVSRPLYIYIKNDHREVVPGMNDFLSEYVSEESFGEFGYLTDRGLIVLSEDVRVQVRENVENSVQMETP